MDAVTIKSMLTDSLIALAIIAQGFTYSPYSRFPVGAALFAYNEGKAQVFTGANVENASYGLTICAERVALFAAITAGYTVPQELVVVTDDGKGQSCGACRQVMNEFNPDMKVIFCNALGEIISRTTVKEMLPGAFGPENLK
jgi:cytidine deaminase